MNRKQLDEFAVLGVGSLISSTIASLIPFIPNEKASGVTGNIGNLTSKDVEALLARGINPFQKERQTGIPLGPVTPQPGFVPSGTGGPNRGGSGPRKETKGFFRYIFGTAGLYVLVCSVVKPMMKDKPSKQVENMCKLITNIIRVILLFLIMTGVSIFSVKSLIPKIRRALKDRSSIKALRIALDTGNDKLAQAVLIDAIEKQGVNLSLIKRRIPEQDFERIVGGMG